MKDPDFDRGYWQADEDLKHGPPCLEIYYKASPTFQAGYRARLALQ